MELESKSTPVVGDLYVAQSDGSLVKEKAKEQNEQPAVNPFKDSRIQAQALRLINALSYALTTISVLSSIHISKNSNEYDNYTVWMTNQTLLSVAPYTQYIWYMLFFLQGLFIAASFLPSLWSSELLGYTEFAAVTGKEAIKKPLPVVLYPALCASTVLMVHSFKMNMMGLAFVGSCACTYLLVTIMRFQVDTATGLSNENAFSDIKRWFQRRRASASTLQSAPDENTLNNFLNDVDVTNQIQQYIFIKLPFELYAGYNLALNVTLLNVIVHKSIGSAVLNVVLAHVSLVLLLGVGCYVMWKEKKGLCYGVGAGLAWYLFGVFFQLIDLSAPIMVTYSGEAITATKYMSVIFANILISTVILRAVKNVINVRVVCGGNGSDEMAGGEEDEDDAVTGYAQV